MNILHVVDMISQERAGGSAKVPYQLGEAQARLGHNVTIFTSDYEAENQWPPKGVELVKFKCAANVIGMKVTPDMLWADYSKFDIIHLHNYRTYVNLAVARQKKPMVLQAHGNAAPMKSLKAKPVNYLCRRYVLNRCSAFIADAEMEIEHFMAEGAKREQISLIPVGIDYREFAYAPETMGKKPNGKKTVLFLGRFHPIKAPDMLVKAFALLSRNDTVLEIAGVDYGVEGEMRRLVKQLGIEDKVRWLGPLYGADKVKAYANADVNVMPSRYEMFGLTFLEALACGTPVIITDRCGSAPLLPPECGQVVPFDEHELAKAINCLLDRDSAKYFRQYRRDWAKQYDWMNIAPKVIEVYERVSGK